MRSRPSTSGGCSRYYFRVAGGAEPVEHEHEELAVAIDEVAALLVERRGQLARHEPVQERVWHHRQRVARRRVLAAADEEAYDSSAPRHRGRASAPSCARSARRRVGTPSLLVAVVWARAAPPSRAVAAFGRSSFDLRGVQQLIRDWPTQISPVVRIAQFGGA